MKCSWKHCPNEPKGSSKWCSVKCKNKTAVDNFRKRLKIKAIQYLGGKCCSCGYDKCVSALEFHHRDPSVKDFGIGSGDTKKWESIQKELDKCDLLCANCHREVHYALNLVHSVEVLTGLS